MPFDQATHQLDDRVLKALVDARALISDVRHWTTGVLKTTHQNGHDQWCALGAIYEVTGMYYLMAGLPRHGRRADGATATRAIEHLARFARNDLGADHSIAQHNNTLGHAATIAMFDQAIENPPQLLAA